MRSLSKLFIFSAVFAVVLPNLYGLSCDRSLPVPATVTSPTPGEVIPIDGQFTASVVFPAVLTSSSVVAMEIQTGGGSAIDVTSAFLPPAQSDFAGATGASANLDAIALGLVPGTQTFIVRVDVDGVGGPAVRLVPFTWVGSAACAEAASAALSDCFLDATDATRQCYATTTAACSPTDPLLVAAEDALRLAVTSACSDGGVQSLGYGAALTANGLADRLVEECVGNAATLAARMYGGPHAKVLASPLGQSAAGSACLDTAYAESAGFVDAAYNVQRDCVLAPGSCSAATVESDVEALASQSQGLIEAACNGGGLLEFLIGLTPTDAIARAESQGECMVGAAHPTTAPLVSQCAPGSLPGVTVVQTQPTGLTPFAPGVPTQIQLDEAVWGTRCGDGSPYTFWVRLPPAGNSAANLAVHMQGGGVCVVDFQCFGVEANSPSLFSSTDDDYFPTGIFNPDPAVNDFADWTHVFLPYCTQDVFTGGGVTQVFPRDVAQGGDLVVERYGAVDARAALRVVRNILGDELNNSSPDGYRPDLLHVNFNGSSAGGFGVVFNLHHVLDEERWTRSTFVNDAALGLDSGGTFSISALGAIAQLSWATRLTQPPYCLSDGSGADPSCAIGPVLNAAHSERLLGVPEQQLLILSNQVDDTQVSTTNWPSTAAFVTETRVQYCNQSSLPGVKFFLDGLSTSLHTYMTVDSRYYNEGIGTTSVADWVEQAVFDPTNLPNIIEEGTLATELGIAPFGCP